MAAHSEFFGHRSAPAVLKHGVLARYAHYFAGRAGAATSGRVAFIDCYAGEGRYEDGSPGSPLLLASQAERARVFGRDVKLAFVEQHDKRRAQLEASLREHAIAPDQLLGGSAEDVIDGLLDRYARHAVLLFVDPFGLAVTHETLQRVLQRRTTQQPLDVLYHFSVSTVARMGAAAIGSGPAAGQVAAQLDATLGPVAWREHFARANAPQEATEAALAAARRFGKSVRASTGVPSTGVQVRERPGHVPKYLLLLFSANRKAHWDFADHAAMAYVDWLYHCDRADYEANVRSSDARGLLELFARDEPDRSEIDDELGRAAAGYLPGHLRQQFSRGPFRLIDDVEAAYGDLLVRARVKHLRAAIKQLHDVGDVDDNGRGDFWERPICWTRPSNG